MKEISGNTEDFQFGGDLGKNVKEIGCSRTFKKVPIARKSRTLKKVQFSSGKFQLTESSRKAARQTRLRHQK